MSQEYETLDDLLAKTEHLVGERVGKYCPQNEQTESRGKGNIGQIIESGHFGIDNNNDQEPDFKNLGVELKVTGYKWVNKRTKVSAKERLVITMIDYFNDINVDFYDSHCYQKIAKMLLIFYEYELDKSEYDFIIYNYYLYEYNNIPEKDKLIIEDDYQTILSKIKDGKAHELSEGDTLYLSACTKGASSKSVADQPFSSIKAKKRAFALKSGYMTYLLRENVFHKEKSRESFIKDIQKLRNSSLSQMIFDAFQPYEKMSLSEIDKLLKTPVNRVRNKQYIKSYVSRMLDINQRNLESIEEFKKANILIKTVRINKSGKINESMSFPAFDFRQVAKEEWEESEIKYQFTNTKFLFVVFEEIDDSSKEYRFKGVKLWSMPEEVIDDQIRLVWERTNDILNSEIKVQVKNNRVINNFPKESENKVAHVRPHGKNRNDSTELPETTKILVVEDDGTVNLDSFIINNEFTKQCFWINKAYLLDVLKILD